MVHGPINSAWSVKPDLLAALAHSVPHSVVSQVLRPGVSVFLPSASVVLQSSVDAQHCTTSVALADLSGPVCALGFLMRLPRLTALDLSDSQIDCAFVAGVVRVDSRAGSASRLCVLNLSFCDKVDTECLALVSELSDLQTLKLGFCDGVNAAGMAYVAKLRHLRTLTLTQCPGIDTEALALIADLSQLQELDLSWCDKVDQHGLAHLARLPRLTLLDLTFNQLSAADTACLSHVPSVLTESSEELHFN